VIAAVPRLGVELLVDLLVGHEVLATLQRRQLGADQVLVDLREVAQQRALFPEHFRRDLGPSELLRRLETVPPGDEAEPGLHRLAQLHPLAERTRKQPPDDDRLE
jgi:hypothetical protein